MNALNVGLALLLLAGVASAQQSSCNSAVAIRARVTSTGFCKLWGKASCETHTKSISVIKEQVKIAFSSGPCVEVNVNAASVAIARAFAKVSTSAMSSVRCTGKGWGCGFAISDGRTFATAFARVVVQTIAAAADPTYTITSLCQADVEALAGVFVKAVSSSQARACADGNAAASRFESNVVTSVKDAIVFAFVKSTAKICDKPKVRSSCDIDGGAGSVAPGSTSQTGSGSSSVSTGPGGSASTSGGSTGSTINKTLHDCPGNLFQCCVLNKCPGGHIRRLPSAIAGVSELSVWKGGNAVCGCRGSKLG